MSNENKIIISYDSGIDVDPDIASKSFVRVIPHKIMFDEKIVDDSLECGAELIRYHNETGNLAKALSLTEKSVFKEFSLLEHQGYSIIHLTFSAKFLEDYDNLEPLTQKLAHFHLVDTRNVSVAGGLLVKKAVSMVEAGAEVDEIISYLEAKRAKLNSKIIVGDASYLHDMGKINFASGFLMALFRKSFLVSVERDGDFIIEKNFASNFEKTSVKCINKLFKNNAIMDKRLLYVGHTGIPSNVMNAVRDTLVSNHYFTDVKYIKCYGTLVSSYGNGAVLLGWFDK